MGRVVGVGVDYEVERLFGTEEGLFESVLMILRRECRWYKMMKIV